ncbi:serine/threonine-protein kinase [Nonomuraea zeae]|uniref:Serine/threonine protein kinase n=1 Tax=Nonomuraea zeae TaxID=1642303 RepID=A0A5S4GBG4_9ACTN|nr:serine/threonine-protein kinase [Nonomuraea zeae]TMR30357.1 serine/threonine protein kinase [Nonomuraea zeae]
MNPLIADDPARIDAYRVTGRLGEGGQGVVYLGESPDGGRVAIKMLGAGLDDPDARTRFRQEIGYARRVKAFCTAQVLAAGELGGTPYVVSEYVDGPSLAEVIRERGTLGGAELRRLAIGTLTALSAIHQAGVVHRDFKPGNVLLSRDGPRVIDFGISRALEEAEPGGGHLVGTPPYMAPEQFGGRPTGPAADLFSWAATMVAAATGRPPFGTGDLPALINRILSAEPDLGGLDGDLRELAARCLVKEPGARPTATRALLTLLGHRVPEQVLRQTGEQALLAEGQQSAAPPARRRRWPVMAGTAGLALAVTAALLFLRPAPAPPAPASAPTHAPLPAPRQGPLAPTSVSELRLPDTRVTLHENPADPVWVSSYHDQRSGTAYPSYTRDQAKGTFAFFGNFDEPIVSPGGGYVASLSATRFRRTDFETIRLRDRATGRDRDLRTVDKPATLFSPLWSEDGRRLLATIMEGDRALGFVVVDPVAGSVEVTRVAGDRKNTYAWGSGGDSVLHQAPGGAVQALDMHGRALRAHPGVGELLPGGAADTTFGTVFTTKCFDNSRNICLWDEQSGARKGVIRLPKGAAFRGWLDEGHFLATRSAGANTDVVLMDANGRAVRVLADGPAAEIDKVVLWFTRR